MASDYLGPPYGPPSNLKAVFGAWRNRGLPAQVDRAWFERIGLSGNLTTRNLHALRYLRLVDDAGHPTDLAERIRIASSDAFASTLAAIVRTSYAKPWSLCDPAAATRAQIEDAFRHESPAAQRGRMVACFIGLCELAGLRRPAPPAVRQSRGRGPRRLPVPAVEPKPPASAPRELPRAVLEALLAKFPDFDPTWPDAVKVQWFDAFARLRDELTR